VDEHEIDTRGRTDRAIVRDLFLAHGVDDSPEHWRLLAAAYLRHLPRHLRERNGRVLPGVNDLLAALRAREDLHIGLLTGNTQEGARAKLAHFQLHEHFAFGGYGDAHLDRNQVAAAAQAELRRRSRADFPADRIWVIGDTPHDVACARHIGAKVLAVATGNHEREELVAARADMLLDDLGDVERVLEIVAPASRR
jgi:phosphoglycolate phosphatase-like HAD superfamily hydrolase